VKNQLNPPFTEDTQAWGNYRRNFQRGQEGRHSSQAMRGLRWVASDLLPLPRTRSGKNHLFKAGTEEEVQINQHIHRGRTRAQIFA